MTDLDKRPHGGLRALPPGIWALGFVSLLMDSSTELIQSLLPVFLTVTLGASAGALGLIEGIAEATAAFTKIFSGALSDYLGRHKCLTVLGYGLAALTKPLFPLAATVHMVLGARFLDRIGKGIRGAPRDALIGELAPRHLRGASYGLRQALDSVGAALGPLLAALFMFWFSGHIRLVFWIAVIPAFLCVATLIFAVREPENPAAERSKRPRPHWRQISQLTGPFWSVAALAIVVSLGRFSEAFLLLKAQDTGLAPARIPLVLVLFNVIYALASYPAGALSDRIGRRGILALGLALLVAGDILLARAAAMTGILAGVSLWGLQMAFTSGLFSALVADTTPPHLRGTAFGIFNFMSGAAMLAANAAAGILWDHYGSGTAFLASAACAALALLLVFRLPRVRPDEPAKPV